MNTTPFPGSGFRMASPPEQVSEAPDFSQENGSWREEEAFADAVQGALSEPIPSGAGKDRGIFERSIAARRVEKAKQQEIARAALAKAKQLTASIRSMEDALDGLLVSEVA